MSVLDITLIWKGSSDVEASENAEYPFIAYAPGLVVLDRAISMGLIERNCVQMLNWIIWNRTVFDTETVYLC